MVTKLARESFSPKQPPKDPPPDPNNPSTLSWPVLFSGPASCSSHTLLWTPRSQSWFIPSFLNRTNQLHFWPMGHYAATTFTSHIRIPFNYSRLLHLQPKIISHMNTCIADLDHFDFKLSDCNCHTLNSTFELYKSDTIQIFKLFYDPLTSLPHVPNNNIDTGTLLPFLLHLLHWHWLRTTLSKSPNSNLLLRLKSRKQTCWLTSFDFMTNTSTNWMTWLKTSAMSSKHSRYKPGFYSVLTESLCKSFWTLTSSGQWSQCLKESSTQPLTRNLHLEPSASTSWTSSSTTSRTKQQETNFTTLFINLPTFTNWTLLSFTGLKNTLWSSFFMFHL